MLTKPLHILISPLDWGLGHASRCIPIIIQLINTGHKVTIAGYGRSLILLQKEFPDLESIELQGFSPSFHKAGKMIFRLFMLLPHFIRTNIREHCELKRLINKYHFDIIISDNRYGLWNKKVRCILITHQVMVKTPAWLKFAEYPVYLVSRLLISRFDECWIPDYKESPGLSGDLAHKYPLPKNAKFIGPLSRFQKSDSYQESNTVARKITAIISGPEPQRSIFEALIIKQLKGLNLEATLLTGKPESENTIITIDKLTLQPHLSSTDLRSLIESSALVICRSGYSSIMDLQALGAKALFVPTPGQTEQIYLAELHYKSGTVLYLEQKSLNLEVDIESALKYPGFNNNINITGIAEAIVDLKKK